MKLRSATTHPVNVWTKEKNNILITKACNCSSNVSLTALTSNRDRAAHTRRYHSEATQGTSCKERDHMYLLISSETCSSPTCTIHGRTAAGGATVDRTWAASPLLRWFEQLPFDRRHVYCKRSSRVVRRRSRGSVKVCKIVLDR